jgi:hypothetical protein
LFLLILKAHLPILSNDLNTPKVWEYKESSGLIRKAKTGDGVSIGPRLRKADLKEIEAYSKLDPGTLIEDTIKIYGSSTYTIEHKGLPIGLFGVVPSTKIAGVIWMVGSDDIVSLKIPFLRNCRFWVEAFSELYPILFNVVSKANTLHIDWLKWLGFKFMEEHKEYGLNKEPFIEFIKIKL